MSQLTYVADHGTRGAARVTLRRGLRHGDERGKAEAAPGGRVGRRLGAGVPRTERGGGRAGGDAPGAEREPARAARARGADPSGAGEAARLEPVARGEDGGGRPERLPRAADPGAARRRRDEARRGA